MIPLVAIDQLFGARTAACGIPRSPPNSGACITSFDAVHPVRDPAQATGLVTVGIVGDGVLAIGGTLAEGQVTGGNHFYLWWLGLFFTDVFIYLGRKLSHT